MTLKKLNMKLVMLALVSLLIAVWAGLFAALFVLKPSLVAKTVLVTITAVTTELIFYTGAALCGISAFKRIRNSWWRRN